MRGASGLLARVRLWSGAWRLVGATIVVLAVVWPHASPALADALDDQTRQIAKRLQCPVCEGVSVADSTSELAGQMRAVIRRKLEAGETEAQILEYFVARYGDGILVEPPRRGFSLAVWLGPMVALAIGGVMLGLILRAWSRPRWAATGSVSPACDGVRSEGGPTGDRDQSYRELARRELEQVRRES